MKIELTEPKTITITQPETREITSLTIVAMLDFPLEKKVYINTIEAGQILLYDGPTYDTAGQWTDTDVISDLTNLFNNG